MQSSTRDRIQHLSEKDWAEIRGLAIDLHNDGTWGSDQLKCSVSAFITWIKNNPREADKSIGFH